MTLDTLDDFNGKTLLITGGTGTFGQAVVRRFLPHGLAEIRIFSRDEKKQDEMRRAMRDSRLRFHLGDVRDLRAVTDSMAGVDFVFHAAALKQVPSCEFWPMEAIRTNALGADNVLAAAAQAGVKRVIVLSTDKAAYPINVMGLTKALMEKLMASKAQAAAERGTVLCATRYGNVMGSRGSVIPLFVDQIRTRRPMTVTDPRMTRFLMSIDDAVDLVLFAFRNAEPGDLLVRKAPATTLATLTDALRSLMAPEHPVQVIGTRHGEKLYETLLTREESARAVDQGDFFRVPADTRDLNYEAFFTSGEQRVSDAEDYHSHNTRRLSTDETVQLLRQLDLMNLESEQVV